MDATHFVEEYFNYSLRFDNIKCPVFEKKTIDFLKNVMKCTNTIITFEISKKEKKPHYHIWVETKLAIKSVTNKVNYKFKQSHPGPARSCAMAKDPDGLKSYITKDGDVIYTTLDKAEMDNIKPWIEKSEFSQNDDMADKIIKYLSDQKVQLKNITQYVIVKYMIHYYRKHKKVFNRHYMKNLAHYIWYIIETEHTDADLDADDLDSIDMKYVEWILQK